MLEKFDKFSVIFCIVQFFVVVGRFIGTPELSLCSLLCGGKSCPIHTPGSM